MQTIILCGGTGTRMKEETEFRPKPMVEVGGAPLLWHIMRIYMHYGYNDFIIAAGYKAEMIKEFFHNWRALLHDFSLDTSKGEVNILDKNHVNFKIVILDTGLETLTGGRILKCAPYLEGDEFMITYGDGVSDINLKKLVDFHHKQGTIGTITGVHPQSKYGLVEIFSKTSLITRFREKPVLHEYISGGFMVFKRKALEFFDEGRMEDGLGRLVKSRQLSLFPYDGFWKAADTYNELEQLNQIWKKDRPWAVWEKNE
ncbi:MAG: sugar phosphate nucleotidyltransferase [Microgenomates group bacterium]